MLRGVPLAQDGYFFAPLWTDFRVGPQPGILDWYTTLTGLVALIALTVHGSHYIALKTEGELNARTRRVAAALWPILCIVTVASLVATVYVRPPLLENYKQHPVGYIIPLLVVAGLAAMAYGRKTGHERNAFLGSCVYLGGMLAGAAFGLYPNLLPASTDPAYSLTIYNAAAGRYSLSLGIIWWTLGMVIAMGYFVLIYWMFRGKVRLAAKGDGY